MRTQVGNKVQGTAKDAKDRVGNPLKDAGDKVGDVGKVGCSTSLVPLCLEDGWCRRGQSSR